MDNATHVFVLHYVFKARINAILSSFVLGWNKHPIRTERNWSPDKIWANGMIDLRNSNQVQIAEVQHGTLHDDLTWYGFDPSAPSPVDDGLEQVEVEDVNCPLTDCQLSRLSDTNTNKTSPNFGIDIFP